MATQSAAAASHADLNRNSLFNLKGRIALVTGGGSGIGLMITQALAVNGAKVYITGRTPEKLDRVVETYGKDIEGEIVALKGFDVSDKQHIAKLVKEIESREKCLCILVNNAGISSNTVNTDVDSATELKKELFDIEESNFDDWTSVFTTNVSSVFFTSGMPPTLPADHVKVFTDTCFAKLPSFLCYKSHLNFTRAGPAPYLTLPASVVWFRLLSTTSPTTPPRVQPFTSPACWPRKSPPEAKRSESTV